MNYVDTISTFVITNKWSIIFILFAIFAAYSLGVQYASTRRAESFAEGFKPTCETNVGIPLEPEVPSITPTKEKPKTPAAPAAPMQRKIVIIKNKKETTEAKAEAEDTDEDNDNDDDDEKPNNCPNMRDYVLKDAVRKKFISKRNLDTHYIKKETCLAQIDKNKKALEEIRETLEQKREAHMERERQKLENQKQILIEQREKLRILKEKYEKHENNEICDKKISNIKKNVSKHQQPDDASVDASADESDAEDTVPQKQKPQQNPQQPQRKQQYPQQQHQRNPMQINDCDDDDDSSNIKPKNVYNPYTNSRKQTPDMLKQQDMFDKNRTAMDDNYNYLNDAYSTCNLGNCTVNGFPSGLTPLKI